MTRWKKVLLVLVALLLLSQIPFAYRRYKLGKLHAAILTLNSTHQRGPSDGLAEYVGVMHVHSFLGGHSAGTFQELIEGARANHLNFVLMTEHTASDFDTAAMTLKGMHGGVLFVNGNEVVTKSGDRILLLPGDQETNESNSQTTQEVLSRHEQDLSIVAYPDEFRSWDAKDYEGIEVYNVYSNAKKIKPLLMLFDAVWSYHGYPDLMFATFYVRPDENLKKWDEEIVKQKRKLVATAGNDAHSNVGVSLNDSSGKTLLGIKVDPYERSFRLVRIHVLTTAGEPLNETTILNAISKGHCFIGYDLFGDTSDFRLSVSSGNEKKLMGDEVKLASGAMLNVDVPVPARIVLLRDGVIVQEEADVRNLKFSIKETGSYRVEVYLPLPEPAEKKPWIISNPIYVR